MSRPELRMSAPLFEASVVNCNIKSHPKHGNVNKHLQKSTFSQKNEKVAQKQTRVETKQRARSNTLNSPALTALTGGPITQSPLLLSKNHKRNPSLPPLTPAALPSNRLHPNRSMIK